MQHLNLPSRIVMFSICSSIEYDIKKYILNCTSEIEFDKDMIEKVKERISKKIQIEQEMNQERILNSLDLSDYVVILLKDPYKYKLNNINIEKIKEYFEKIIPIRNRVMHTKPLELGDKAILEEVLETIDNEICFIKWEEVKNTRELLKNAPEKLIDKWKPITYHDNYYHNLPEPEFDDTGYIGRRKEITEITDLIIQEKYPVISIIGNGGIGKTAITVKILYDLIDNPQNPYEAIIWVSLKAKTLANGEFVEIQNAIQNTSEMLNETQKEVVIDNNITPKENIINFMKNFKTLLVIDNLETINDNSINEFIKSVPKESNILITSRTGLGELEYRYNLSGMNQNDGIRYFRELSKYYGLDIHKRNDKTIEKLVKEILYSNPLSIKWYINGIYNGIREEILQNNKFKLIEFCMSNVYDKLSDEAKEILKLFQIEDFEMSYGEIEFYIEKEELKMKKAINELLSTNMMHLKNTEYQIDVMAKDYLQLHETPSAEFIEKISNKKKQLNDMLQDIKVKKENSILDPNSILYDYDNKDNKIAAIYLYKALELGRDKNLEDALLMTDRASNVAPNYFECYKIKGFLNANAQNLAEAIKNYQIAVNKCTNDLEYATAYYVFSFFYTVTMQDNEKAYELICEAEKHLPNNPEILLQKTRAMTRLGKFSEAEVVLKSIKDENKLSDKVKNIQASVTANLYRKWSEMFEQRDSKKKLEYLNKGIKSIEKLDKIDKKTYVNLIALLKEISLMYYDNDAMILLKNTLKNNFNGLKTINHKDINFINNIIEDHKYEINENIYNELKKFLTDYRKLAKNIIDRDLGVVVYFPRPYGFIANAYNESIYFNVSRLRRSIDVGDIVKFNLKQSTKGDVAINIRKINKTMEDFIDKN